MDGVRGTMDRWTRRWTSTDIDDVDPARAPPYTRRIRIPTVAH